MSQFRVEKRRAQAELTLSSGHTLRGIFFLAGSCSLHAGPERIADLLNAARLVIAQNPKVHFAFVGDGAYREQYQLQAKELGISEHVTFTGQVEDPLGDGVYAAADIVCQVSRWEEVFGYVIAEAMSCAKPMVATRVGGIPELVEDGKTGFVVERGEVATIADRILRLVADPELREQDGSRWPTRLEHPPSRPNERSHPKRREYGSL